ncbi:MAG: hypothetical protein IJB35_02160 [Oscillospiraceae bacterium]|nr:hypothetical protein [Oscillospiraceae bacterium]
MPNNMQFSTFVWPNNPERCCLKFSRIFQFLPDDDGVWDSTELTRMECTYECEGFFRGEGAYGSIRALDALFRSGTVGTLTHPQWDEAEVLITELEVLEEAGENFLRYRIVFSEIPFA